MLVPDNSAIRQDLAPILKRISDRRRRISPAAARPAQRGEESKLVRQFQEQTANHYQEIIENCEVNFTNEIEFEIFRRNFTYEDAEEIRKLTSANHGQEPHTRVLLLGRSTQPFLGVRVTLRVPFLSRASARGVCRRVGVCNACVVVSQAFQHQVVSRFKEKP